MQVNFHTVEVIIFIQRNSQYKVKVAAITETLQTIQLTENYKSYIVQVTHRSIESSDTYTTASCAHTTRFKEDNSSIRHPICVPS